LVWDPYASLLPLLLLLKESNIWIHQKQREGIMFMFKKYKIKPIVIEAFQWNGERPLPEPLIGNWDNNPMTPGKVSIKTYNGYQDVHEGDYIIKDSHTDTYFVHNEAYFKSVYELMEEVKIERKPVSSSNIKTIGWENNILEVEFTGGGIYQYEGVPENVCNALLKADSIGSSFHTLIKKAGYPYRKIR
jgi:hypothetical protein